MCSAGFILGALSGGDENHTVSTAGTVDGGRCGILQDGHGLDVLGRQAAEFTAGNAVDHHQRSVAGVQGSGATDLKVRAGVRVGTLAGNDVETGHFTREHGHGVVGGAPEEIFAVDLYDGGRQFLLGQGAVANHDYVIQKFAVFFQPDGRRDLLGRENLCCIADATDFHQCFGGRDAQDVVAVQPGGRAIGRALFHDSGANDGSLAV